MPRIYKPTPSINQTVDRPIILQVVKNLMKDIGISDQTKINFFGTQGQAALEGAISTNGEHNRWPYDERITIESTVQVDETAPFDVIRDPLEGTNYFDDQSVGIHIYPVVRLHKCTLSFKYRALDQHQAKAWRNEMSTRVTQLRDLFLHESDFQVKIPDTFLGVLIHLHDLIEATAGYGYSFNDYFTRHLRECVSLQTDEAGENGAWIATERLIRIQGYFEFAPEPDVETRESDHDNHSVTLNYHFYYDRVIEVGMQYPIMVHNQFIDERLIPKPQDIYRLENQPRQYRRTGFAYANLESDQRLLKVLPNEAVVIPDFDDWRPPIKVPNYIKIAQLLLCITPTDRRSLLDLKDLGDVRLDENLMSYLRLVGDQCVTNEACLYEFVLYENGTGVPQGVLKIDPDLNLYASEDLDLRKTYRIALYVCVNPSTLRPAIFDQIKNHPKMRDFYVRVANSALRGMTRGDLPNTRLSAVDLGKLYGSVDPRAVKANDPFYLRDVVTNFNHLGKI